MRRNSCSRTATLSRALDGVRGLYIASVILRHLALELPRIGDHGALLDKIVGSIGRFGYLGVDLFFVLSGFLITGILIDAKGGEGYFRAFYARRTIRIFPLYYAVCVLFLLVLPRVPLMADDPQRKNPRSQSILVLVICH